MRRVSEVLEFHPLAATFPLLGGPDFEALVDDIRTRGLLEPVTLREGQILDGRNRYRACREAGVEPRFREYEGDDALGFVIALNLKRRHLNESQRAMAAARVANLDVGRPSETAQICAVPQDQAADRLNVSRRSVQIAAKVQREASPEVAAAVDEGAIPISVAAGLADRDDGFQRDVVERVRAGTKPAEAIRQTRREELADNPTAFPVGKYRVLYADPPWKYGDERALEGYDATAAETHYPTQTVAELCEFCDAAGRTVPDLAHDDAVLFCWATFPLLPDALRVVAAWGFKYKTAIVWSKQRSNLGHYHNASAELLLVCTRGSCTPDGEKRPDQVQVIPRTGRHSEKPEEFRELVDTMYPSGPRVELFRRGEAPAGWKVWGNEVTDT